MFWTLFYLLMVFFVIGGIALSILNKRSDTMQRKRHWIKYIFYLVVVSITIGCIQLGLMPYMAVVLIAIGAYEMLMGWYTSNRRAPFLLLSGSLYMVIAWGFYRFSHDVAPERLLFVYSIVVTFDGFAQITGQLFGKKKVLPKTSPNKTIGGLVGGYVMGIATGLLMLRWMDTTLQTPGYTPLFLCTAAFTGDALASWYKRRCSIKDYGNLIPEHGGVLDRYDSFIASGAVFWLIYL
ncbi:phosphatidate cytidylyltransferase [Parapedobacter sp.]